MSFFRPVDSSMDSEEAAERRGAAPAEVQGRNEAEMSLSQRDLVRREGIVEQVFRYGEERQGN